jgi:hypothetical protein
MFHEHLKSIRFAGELLPDWAHLLDLAARLCPVPEDSRRWFSKLTGGNGVDDSRTVIHHCRILRSQIEEHRAAVSSDLQRSQNDAQPSQVVAAWLYALDTMMQQAECSQTCSWTIDGAADNVFDDSDDGDIGLRRV